MVRKNDEAGRGRHLAPALEVVSADASEHSPTLLTKQANCTHATAFMVEVYDYGDLPRLLDDGVGS